MVAHLFIYCESFWETCQREHQNRLHCWTQLNPVRRTIRTTDTQEQIFSSLPDLNFICQYPYWNTATLFPYPSLELRQLKVKCVVSRHYGFLQLPKAANPARHMVTSWVLWVCLLYPSGKEKVFGKGRQCSVGRLPCKDLDKKWCFR